MSQKTSQLQIRVSPEEKALLKRLAEGAGMSVSGYVLDAALPKAGSRLRELTLALGEQHDRPKILSDLRLALTKVPSDEIDAAMAGLDVDELTPVQQSLAAAAFEQEARARRTAAPAWTAAIPPLKRPAFGPDLGSLRPYLLCSTPPALKRRNTFVSLQDRRPGSDTIPAEHPPLRPATETEERLTRLDQALGERGLFVELSVVGGAVMPFVFDPAPATRRPRALFASRDGLTSAVDATAPELDRSWLDDAAREIVRPDARGTAPFFAGHALAILEPPAAYVLAMTCLTLAWAPGPHHAVERDMSYLLRFLGLEQPRAALERITSYLNPRYVPHDLDQRLPRLV